MSDKTDRWNGAESEEGRESVNPIIRLNVT